MLHYEIIYRFAGPERHRDEVSGHSFAECCYKFASKMVPGYIVLEMRFLKVTKL